MLLLANPILWLLDWKLDIMLLLRKCQKKEYTQGIISYIWLQLHPVSGGRCSFNAAILSEWEKEKESLYYVVASKKIKVNNGKTISQICWEPLPRTHPLPPSSQVQRSTRLRLPPPPTTTFSPCPIHLLIYCHLPLSLSSGPITGQGLLLAQSICWRSEQIPH